MVRREHYEILVLTWTPSQGSVAHDHSGSLCGLKVVQGSLTEHLFARDADGQVRRTAANHYGAGTTMVDPGVVVHSLENSSPGEVLVTVHVYSPPLPEVRRYAVAESAMPELFLRPPAADASIVAIIGGGFTGLMVFANLLRFAGRTDLPLHIVLIDRQTAVGEGVAYRTTDRRHLLNVPAGRMSAWCDQPHHFLAFAQSRDRESGPNDFLPRNIYGQYVRETVLALARSAGHHMSAQLHQDEVASLSPSSTCAWRMETESGRTIEADVAVLAVGHRPPGDPFGARWAGPRTRFVSDPWAALVLSQIGPDEPVLLLGSGLTAVDVILTLSRADRRAPILAVSRRGLMPAVHLQPKKDVVDAFRPAENWSSAQPAWTIRSLVSTVRQQIRLARNTGIPWQHVLDAMRPQVSHLWRQLSEKERSRFLRHVRPFWETHRHRTAPAVAETIARLRREQALEIVSGGLVAAAADDHGVEVTFSQRGSSATRTVRVAWVVNCTGPGAHNRHDTHPFLRPLLRDGTLSSDAFCLGLLTDDAGHALREDGALHADLLVAGTLRKATLWESTAVPELRQQAETVAQVALQTLLSRRTALAASPLQTA